MRSSTYLIRRVVFRPNHHISQARSFSLMVRPLGELLDMYHTREASDPRDKVYALLGMSSDRQRYTQLSPNYNIPWHELLQRLIKLLINENALVTTWKNEVVSVIESDLTVIGEIVSVNTDRLADDRQRVEISLWTSTTDQSTPESNLEPQWVLQPYAKSVLPGDIICALKGASTPTIIRPYAD
jgi:hypothetical protein